MALTGRHRGMKKGDWPGFSLARGRFEWQGSRLPGAASVSQLDPGYRHLIGDEYGLSQLRYDLSKLRAKGLVERICKSRRYCLTPIGLKLGVLLVKLRLRLLGPLTSLIRQTTRLLRVTSTRSTLPTARSTPPLDHLSVALGLQRAA